MEIVSKQTWWQRATNRMRRTTASSCRPPKVEPPTTCSQSSTGERPLATLSTLDNIQLFTWTREDLTTKLLDIFQRRSLLFPRMRFKKKFSLTTFFFPIFKEKNYDRMFWHEKNIHQHFVVIAQGKKRLILSSEKHFRFEL